MKKDDQKQLHTFFKRCTLVLDHCQLQMSDSRPVCSWGLAKKAFFGANILWPASSMGTPLCWWSLVNLSAVQKLHSARMVHIYSQPTESHKFTTSAKYWQVFNVKFYILVTMTYILRWSTAQEKVWVYSTVQHMSVWLHSGTEILPNNLALFNLAIRRLKTIQPF